MTDPSMLSPEDLDRLEDALGNPERAAELPPELRSLHAAYVRIEDQARTALEATDVPPGLEARILDAVGRELARGSAPAAAPRPETTTRSDDDARRRPRWWMPLLAVAGAAAIVLLWTKTTPEADPARSLASRTVREAELEPEARPAAPSGDAPATVREKAEAPPPGGGPDSLVGAGAGESTDRDQAFGGLPAVEEAVAPEERAAAGSTRAAPAKRKKRRAGRRARTDASLPEPLDDAPRAPTATGTPRPEAKGGAAGASAARAGEGRAPSKQAAGGGGANELPLSWKTLARADRDRRLGRCDLAEPVYAKLTRAGDRRLAARAYAGLGLCAQARGRDGSASFERARALDPQTDAFVDAEPK